MTTDEAQALEAFERLGLTRYEANVFIALQRLGTGTARDVSEVVDVPRSQVYSVAESLEERGLLEVQQSSPIRYRPVEIDEARETLEKRFEREQERAFGYVEEVKEQADRKEEPENVWIVRDRDRITDRVRDTILEANRRIILATHRRELVDEEIETALERRTAEGVALTVHSDSKRLRARFESLPETELRAPIDRLADDRSGRVVIADEDTVLLSVIDADGTETAIWSSESLFASVLIQLATSGLTELSEPA